MSLRSRLGVASMTTAALVALALGCGPRSRGAAPTSPSPQAVAPLSRAMLGSASGGGLAQSEALDRLLEAPEVVAAGERLLARLGDDPELEPLYAETLAGVMAQPALLQALARMAAQQPGTSPEALGEQVSTRLSAGIDGPVFDAALDDSLDRLFDRSAVDQAIERVADLVLDRSLAIERLTALLMQWSPELEAALGVPMGDERFEARLQQRLSDPALQAALSQLLGERLADDPGVRGSLAALLDDEAFFAACKVLVREILSGPDFHASVTAVLTGMLDEVDAQELGRRVDRVLVTPEVERAVVAWFDAIATTPAATTFAERLGAALDDPNLQAELFTIVVGAPTGPTA